MAKDKSKKKKSEIKPKKPQFVVKLSVEGYRDFAKWMTEKDPTFDPNKRRYQVNTPANKLPDAIGTLLDGVAEVYVDCGKASDRKFKATEDKIKIHRDNGPGGAVHDYPMALPLEICETVDGEIDLLLFASADGR